MGVSGVGMRGVVISASSTSSQEEFEARVLKERKEAGPTTTVVAAGPGTNSAWLRERNETLRGVKVDELKAVQVLLCEGGACRDITIEEGVKERQGTAGEVEMSG